ncbi:MAG TPA: pitrilysin family protein, partial [Oligoflexia bacterium]|nr:pitrilysin family protein [Oligoflexia bacterium]
MKRYWNTTLVLTFMSVLIPSLYSLAEARQLVQEQSALPLTTFNVTFRVGSVDDPAGKAGMAAVVAELVRNGGVAIWKKQPARSRLEFEKLLFPLAAVIETSVQKEQTSFRVTTAASNSIKVFKLLTQLIVSPGLNISEFERIKGETLDYLKEQFPREDQEELGKAALDLAIYGKGHPYAHPVAGLSADVQTITHEEAVAFYKKYFTQKRIIVAAAGRVTDELKRAMLELEAALPAGDSSSTKIPPAPVNKGISVTIVEGPFDGTGVHLGHALPINRRDERFAQLVLAANGFGKHRSFVGRLMHVVREVRGLNYGTYSYVEDFPYGGRLLTEPLQVARQIQAFTVWGRPTPHEDGCFLTRQIFRELQSLKTQGLTTEEFTRTKSHLQGALPILGSPLERRLGYAVDSVFYGTPSNYLAELVTRLSRASNEAVKNTIQKYIDTDNL